MKKPVIILIIAAVVLSAFRIVSDNFFRLAVDSHLIYADPVCDNDPDMNSFDFSACFGGNLFLKILFDLNRVNYESRIIDGIKSQNIYECNQYVYLAAYYRYDSAVGPIADKLLEAKRIYGWEGPRYDKPEDFVNDLQYPWQCMYILAIENISGENVRNMKLLSTDEHDVLMRTYGEYLPLERNTEVTGNEGDSLVAYWLLEKLGYDVKLYR